jgi:hypothetical protein
MTPTTNQAEREALIQRLRAAANAHGSDWDGVDSALMREAADALSQAPVTADRDYFPDEAPCHYDSDRSSAWVAGAEQGYKDGWQAALSQAPVAVPAGYALVPVEPTLEMLTAASLEDDKAFIDGSCHGAARGDLWAAMLSAATTPQPAAEPVAEVKPSRP